MTTEPVAIGAAVQGVIVAVLAVLVGTGTITPELSGLLLGVAVAVIALVAVLVRAKVTPNSKV